MYDNPLVFGSGLQQIWFTPLVSNRLALAIYPNRVIASLLIRSSEILPEFLMRLSLAASRLGLTGRNSE